MDWTQIITVFIGTSGVAGVLIAIVTLVERKSALMLENAQKLAESYQQLANEYQQLANEYQERESKTQGLLGEKDAELLNQIKMNSSLRHNLDDAHTECAVAKLMYCKKAKCIERDPPFGSDAGKVLADMKLENKKNYTRKDE
jgi:hypothetical protein